MVWFRWGGTKVLPGLDRVKQSAQSYRNTIFVLLILPWQQKTLLCFSYCFWKISFHVMTLLFFMQGACSLYKKQVNTYKMSRKPIISQALHVPHMSTTWKDIDVVRLSGPLFLSTKFQYSMCTIVERQRNQRERERERERDRQTHRQTHRQSLPWGPP